MVSGPIYVSDRIEGRYASKIKHWNPILPNISTEPETVFLNGSEIYVEMEF